MEQVTWYRVEEMLAAENWDLLTSGLPSSVLFVWKYLFDIVPTVVVKNMEYAPHAAWMTFPILKSGDVVLQVLSHVQDKRKWSFQFWNPLQQQLVSATRETILHKPVITLKKKKKVFKQYGKLGTLINTSLPDAWVLKLRNRILIT